MSGYMLCLGALANHPYKIRETGLLIYSAEELSYYIYNNFYLIDEGFVTDELLSFIEIELGLKASSVRIRQMRDEKSALGVLLLTILREFHYYSETEIKEFQLKFDAYRHNGAANRKVMKADFLLDHGHYLAAIQIYHQFDNARKDLTLPDDFYMKIKQHMAVGYIKLGLYREAMDSYILAYKEKATEELLRQIYEFSLMTELQMPSDIYHDLTPEWEKEWREEYDDVYGQGTLLATTGPTVAMFTKDSVKRKEALEKHIEGIKIAYRKAIS